MAPLKIYITNYGTRQILELSSTLRTPNLVCSCFSFAIYAKNEEFKYSRKYKKSLIVRLLWVSKETHFSIKRAIFENRK